MSVKSALKIKINGQWVAVPVLAGEGSGEEGTGGEDGGYYTPSVDEDTGLLNWTASKSDMPVPPSAVIKGPKGDAGYTPQKNVDYFDGQQGPAGKDGADGKTPIRGTDYWTAADRQSMVNDVVAALPKYNGEVAAV